MKAMLAVFMMDILDFTYLVLTLHELQPTNWKCTSNREAATFFGFL
jgi:hypothetical protein